MGKDIPFNAFNTIQRVEKGFGSIIKNHDKTNFLNRRKEFLNYYRLHDESFVCCPLCKFQGNKKNKFLNQERSPKGFFHLKCINCNKFIKYDLKHYTGAEVYVVKDKKIILEESYTGYNFNPEWNVREVMPAELIIEFDIPYEQAIKAYWDTAQELVNRRIHFSVFYALNMRSPHIRIYDFPTSWKGKLLDYDELYQTKLLFCRNVVDWQYIAYLDLTLLNVGQTLALEFSKHFKHGSMLKLVLEHIPERRLREEEVYYYRKGVDFNAN